MFKSRKTTTKPSTAVGLRDLRINIEYLYQVDVRQIKLSVPVNTEVLNLLYLIAYFKCVLCTPSNVRFREELMHEYSFANSILDLENIPVGSNAYSSYANFREYVLGRPEIVERYNSIILTNSEIHYAGSKIKHNNTVGKCIPPDLVDQIFIASAFNAETRIIEFDKYQMHTGRI